MATAFTNKVTRQGHIFAIALILLWALVIGFVGLRFWWYVDSDGTSTLSPEHILLFDEICFVLAFVITLFISIIALIVARLFNSLNESAIRLEQEHSIAIKQEEDKVRLKRQLTNNINHELKTPICSILGYLEMILGNEQLDCATMRTFVKKSYDQAERLRRLMMDISTITRIDEASTMIEREPIDIMSLVDGIVDDTMPQAESQNIVVMSTIDRSLPISGNYSLLYSIFRNLVDNAVAYSGGRKVVIMLEDEDTTHYYLQVVDNGIGVEQKHLDHIFERFYRVDKGRSRKIGGTGLGLSIVKNAVLFHGGTIVAEIVKSGGLSFSFSLRKVAP